MVSTIAPTPSRFSSASVPTIARRDGGRGQVGQVGVVTNSPGARTSYASRAATRAPGVTHRGADRRPIRLTRRGRLASFVASVLALTAVVLVAGQVADASSQVRTMEPTMQPTMVVVQSGQTLWGIAREVAPDHDPRSVIAQIRHLNDLGTRSIVAGQTLVVPLAN